MSFSENKKYSYEYVQLLPKEQIGEHEQSSWEVSLVVVGHGYRVIGGVKEKFVKDEIIIVPPKVKHFWHFDDEETDEEGRIHNVTLKFEEAFLDSCSLMFDELRSVVDKIKKTKNAQKISGTMFNRLSDRLIAMRNESPQERIVSAMRILVEIASVDNLSSVGNKAQINHRQQRLEKIDTYISCNFCREVAVDDIARYVGMNKSAFCVFFKKATGKTFVTYLNEYKITLACKMLEDEDKTIKEVCYSCGFNDVAYFNRIFKRFKSVAPRTYRKSAMTCV